MNRLQTYMFRQLLTSMVFITLTLTAVLWLTQSMRFLKYILNRGLDLGTFLHVTMLLIPGFWLVILPVSLFFATLFTYNKVINDRELVVMRAAGIGQFGLARPALTLAFLTMGFCYFISLYLMPVAFQDFRRLQTEIRTNISAGLIQEGTFNKVTDGLTIYVRYRRDNEMGGIIVQDDRSKTSSITMLAERGIVVSAPDGPRVVMLNGSRQERNLKTGRVTMLFFARNSFQLAKNRPYKKSAYTQPEERFLGELLHPKDTPADRFYRTTLIAEGHNRLIAPLYAMVLPLIALAALLTGQFNKRGQVLRQVGACAIVAGIEGSAIGLASVTVKLNYLIPLAYLNAVIPFCFFMWLLVRGRRRPRPFSPTPSGGRRIGGRREAAAAGAAE